MSSVGSTKHAAITIKNNRALLPSKRRNFKGNNRSLDSWKLEKTAYNFPKFTKKRQMEVQKTIKREKTIQIIKTALLLVSISLALWVAFTL